MLCFLFQLTASPIIADSKQHKSSFTTVLQVRKVEAFLLCFPACLHACNYKTHYWPEMSIRPCASSELLRSEHEPLCSTSRGLFPTIPISQLQTYPKALLASSFIAHQVLFFADSSPKRVIQRRKSPRHIAIHMNTWRKSTEQTSGGWWLHARRLRSPATTPNSHHRHWPRKKAVRRHGFTSPPRSRRLRVPSSILPSTPPLLLPPVSLSSKKKKPSLSHPRKKWNFFPSVWQPKKTSPFPKQKGNFIFKYHFIHILTLYLLHLTLLILFRISH